MTMVLIHGGGFGASCWDRMIPYLTSPVTSPVLAVDLPGRGAHPADLDTVGVADWAESVITDMDTAGMERAVMVGHSMAGLTMAVLATRVPERIERLVFISCVMPPEGQCAIEAPKNFKPRADGRLMSEAAAKAVLCNGMDSELTAYTLSIMGPDTQRPMHEPVSLSGFANDIPRTYIRLSGDAIFKAHRQDDSIANIGNCDVVTLDCAHMAMISQPQRLAEILNGLVA